jgi:predicted Zn finger-like uncharacterized protein
MAIEVECPSCQSAVHVDDSLAGKDVLCPNCQQRITVPSIASGQPGAMPRRGEESDERFEEGRGEGRGGREAMPRYRESHDDYDVPVRDDRARWSATLTGLGLIFWTWIFIAALFALITLLGMALGTNQQLFAGNPANPPAGPVVAAGLGVMAMACVAIILGIITYVGMCMCCTVPAESGAKGRAITTVLLIALTIVAAIIFFIVLFVQTFQHARQMGAPPPPGWMPFSTTGIIVISVVSALAGILIVTMWQMFHKAIADYFQNTRLARNCIWYLVAYVVYTIGGGILNLMANPMLQGGNMFAPVDQTLLILSQAWVLAWLIGLTIWYLLIVRETRRTIMEDQAPTDDDRGLGSRDPGFG